jgi:glycosyltransferase involved in cell wall biosynthesis
MLVFPGEEDAGIVPVEAQAAGVPVLALGRGGALETVVDGQTGLFFDNEEPAAIARRARELDALQLPAGQCRRHARRFDRGVFLTQMRDVIETALTERARRTAV